MFDESLSAIRDALQDAADSTMAAINEGSGPWTRPYNIGMGQTGCLPSWYGLAMWVHDHMAMTSYQTDDSRVKILNTIKAFIEADHNAATDFNNYQGFVDYYKTADTTTERNPYSDPGSMYNNPSIP